MSVGHGWIRLRVELDTRPGHVLLDACADAPAAEIGILWEYQNEGKPSES